MAHQLRVYTIKEGHLKDWTELFRTTTLPLRRERGFEIQAWSAPERNEFFWLVSRLGTPDEFIEADEAYNAAPEHRPIFEKARAHVERVESFFVDLVAD